MSEMQDVSTAVQGYRPWKACLPSFVLNIAPWDYRKLLWVRSLVSRAG
mgnify:FL=1